MKTLLKAFTYLLLGAVVVIGGYSLIEKPYTTNITNVGVPTQKSFGGSVYYLSGSGITSSATSIGLTKLTIPQNDYAIQDSDLGSIFYMTLEPGSTSRQEFISCTTVGTNTGGTVTLSGCVRGLSAISPYTASTTQRFSHSGGSKLIFSNSPNLYDQALFKGNDETISGTYTYTSTAIPIFDSNPTITDDKHFATKKYIDDVAIAGGTDATLTVKGITEIATQTGMASTSIAGSGDTTAWLSLTSAYSTSTPSGDSYSALFLPVSENDGKLSQLWLDLTEAFTWTGAHIFSSTVDIAGLFTTTATSTMATTTIAELTITNDLTVSGDLTLTGDATGIAKSVDIQDFTADGTWTKPTNAEKVCVQAWGGGGGGGSADSDAGNDAAGGGGGGGAYKEFCFDADDLGATEAVDVGAGGVAATAGSNTTFDILIAYGGGAGVTADAAATTNGGGGGGGGGAGKGGTGTSGDPAATGGVGGEPAGAAAGAAASGFNGAGGGANATAGGKAAFGGAGGGGGNYSAGGGAGGTSIYGGGGGGGGCSPGSAAGGASVFGGNGGAGGSSDTNGTVGTQPAGGGGGAGRDSTGTSTGGAGGDGQVIVTTYF